MSGIAGDMSQPNTIARLLPLKRVTRVMVWKWRAIGERYRALRGRSEPRDERCVATARTPRERRLTPRWKPTRVRAPRAVHRERYANNNSLFHNAHSDSEIVDHYRSCVQ
jgi:hypothetical protein